MERLPAVFSSNPHLGEGHRTQVLWPSLYDAGYVALAQKTRFPLITLDRKLAAIALRSCEIATPNGYRGNGGYFRNRRRLGVHLFELAGVVHHRPRPP